MQHTEESITIMPDENLHITDIFPKSRNSKIEELERTLNAETTQFWKDIDNLKGRHATFTLLDLTLQGGLEVIQHIRKFMDELKSIVNNLIRNQISSDLISNKDLLKIYNQIKENHKDYEIPIPKDLLSATTMSEISILKTEFSNNNIYMLIINSKEEVYSKEETIYRMHSLPIIQQQANRSAMA